MIKPEDNIVCPSDCTAIKGYAAMYGVCDDKELSAGVIVAYHHHGEIYLFQLGADVDILNDEFAPILRGTFIEYLGSPITDGVLPLYSKASIDACLFPTKEELDWYNRQKTV